MKRSGLILAAVFAAGGLSGWLASGYRGPQALAQQPPERAPDPVAKDTPVAEEERPLETLDWLVGDWIDVGEKQSVEFSCHFSKNNAFLIRAFRVLEGEDVKLSGMQVIAWDASLQTIRSWTYDSRGGFGEEIWSQTGNRYTLRSTYTLPDGLKGSSISTLTYINEDECTWKSVHREIGGEFLPDIEEFTIVRKPLAEEPKPEEPKKEEIKKDEPKKEGK